MPASDPHPTPPFALVVTAFASVYLIWGSTYLAIRFAIETLPPLLMAATRFLIAGGLLYGWLRWRGVDPPHRRHWKAATIVGGLLLLGGNGSVVLAERTVPSSLAALMVAMVPLWIVLLDWLRPGGTRPPRIVLLGVVIGLAGTALLVDLGGTAVGTVPVSGALLLLLATVTWSIGSLYSRRAVLPQSPFMATAMEMLAGGALLAAVAILAGEPATIGEMEVSWRSAAALGYLIVFGSIVAFTAYIWLLRVVPAAKVGTYAYVNPVVAVILGWALADEPLTARTLVAAAIIVFAVVLINRRRGPSPAEEDGG